MKHLYLHTFNVCVCCFRELVWELLLNSECSEPLLAETRKIISHNSQSLYVDSGDYANFISYLLDAGMCPSTRHTTEFSLAKISLVTQT